MGRAAVSTVDRKILSLGDAKSAWPYFAQVLAQGIATPRG